MLFYRKVIVRNLSALYTVFIVGCFYSLNTHAHQPVMDMAPRWNGGYGFQLRQEYRKSDTLLRGDSRIANPLGLKQRVSTTWIEGVYTFQRAFRLTLKVPVVAQSRTRLVAGTLTEQKASGLGDIIVAVPLKYYKNWKASTGNIGFTPSLRLPTGNTSGTYPLGDGSVDVGASLNASWETPLFYHFYDAFYWHNSTGDRGSMRGDELSFDANIGIHPYHSNESNSGVFVMLDARVRHEERGKGTSASTKGGDRIALGPVLVLYKGGIMFRSELSFPVYENVKGTQVAFGPQLNIGLGVAF